MALCLGFKFTAVDANGNPLSGGKIYTKVASSDTDKETYSDRAMSTPNTNPIILDTAGQCDLYFSGPTKLIIKDSLDNTIDTVDPVDGIVANGDSPTFTDLTVSDDLTVTDDVTIGGLLAVTANASIGSSMSVTGVLAGSDMLLSGYIQAGTNIIALGYLSTNTLINFPSAIADAAVANNSLFRRSTSGKIAYKDNSGTVTDLY